jgi:ABC-2 type transport system permease protein
VTAATATAPNRGVTQSRVLVSEWIKFRSLRSTWYSLGAAMLISIGLGMLFSGLRGHDVHTHRQFGELLDPTEVSLRGIHLAQLAFGVLGVLLITGEYATGMIKATLIAVPRRVPVPIAKALVFGTASYVLATVMCLLAFLGGQAMLSSYDLGVSLSSPGSVRAVLCGGIYLTVVGLLGLGFGFIVRSTGGAIAALFATVLVLPLLAQALPSSWQHHVNKYLPLTIGNALISVHRDADQLAPGAGIAVLAGYLAVVWAIAVVVLHRRDA